MAKISDPYAVARKHMAIAKVFELMAELDVSLEDIGLAVAAAPPTRRRVKYADSAGNTWAGVGQRPRWLREKILAGASLEDFKVVK